MYANIVEILTLINLTQRPPVTPVEMDYVGMA